MGIPGAFSLSLGESSWIERKAEVRMMGLNLNEQGLVRQSLVRIAFSFGSKCYRNFLFRRIVWNRTLRLRQVRHDWVS
jgi:hypothetical protein